MNDETSHDASLEAPPSLPVPQPTAPPPQQPAGHGTRLGPHHPHVALPEAFAKLGLEPALLYGLADLHFTVPSEIQEKMIPFGLAGRDLLGQARTGTGKTAAFGLPILQRLDLNQPYQAIVVVPTRELAVQVEAELVRLAKHKPVRLACVYGGLRVSGNVKLLGRHPHVVVGTPGRILDLVERQVLPLEGMKFVVCDEVDRMFDIGFRDDIRRILSGCTSPHQTMFVSATISDEIERMVRQHMRNPERIFTKKDNETLTCPEAQQFYAGVNPWDKQRALKLLLRAEKPALALVFCRTKRSVDRVASGLVQDGVNASPIHGDLLQNKREHVMRGFRTGKINVLVATDLASRGIDVHEITHVINYDIPEDPEVYVHRVGRTARMGATGKAITFVAHGQAQMQTEIEKLTNQLLEEYRVPGFHASPEPGQHTGRAYGSVGPAAPETAPTTPAAPSADGQAPTPIAPPVQEGYSASGFGHVHLTTSTRPLSGKFPSRRRR